MSLNYDASNVGVPFVRAHRIEIDYPDSLGMPEATIYQSLAVVLADGTTRSIQPLAPLLIKLDLKDHGDDPIPLVSPVTAAHLGADTTLNNAFLNILAVIRKAQLESNAP